MRGTVDAIERRLVVDGFVQRYDSTEALDRLRVAGGAFLPCTVAGGQFSLVRQMAVGAAGI